MSQHFDVAVIGTQRAGVIAAALMAKRGARVLLVDHGERTTYRRKGLRLPLVPDLIPRLDDAPHVRRVAQELGLAQVLRASVVPLVPALQAVLPQHRIDLRGDAAADLDELVREFPDVRGPLESFFPRLAQLDAQLAELLGTYSPLAPAGIRDHLRLRRLPQALRQTVSGPFEASALFEGIPPDHPVRDVLAGPLAFFGHLWGTTPSTFQAVRSLAAALRGSVVYPDRLGGLSALLMQAAGEAGVEIRRGAVVAHLGLSGRSIASIELHEDRHSYGAELVVAATLEPFHELLPAGRQHAKVAAHAQSVRPVAGLLTLNLVVDRAVIPKGMGDAVVLLNGRRGGRDTDPADPPVLLRRYPAQRGELSTAKGNGKNLVVSDCEVLSAACPAPLGDVQRSPERLAALKRLLFERVKRVAPFLEEHLRDRSHPVDTAEWDIEGEERRVNPLAAHPYFESATPAHLGVAGRSPLTPLKNVFHCGPDVVPGLGLEGDFAAGLAVAELLSARGGKRWPAPGA